MFLLVDNVQQVSVTRIITKTPSFRGPNGNINKNKLYKNLIPIGSKLKTKTILTVQN